MKLLITRPIDDLVLAQAKERFETTYRAGEVPMSAAEVTAALGEFDAILPTLGDAFTAAAIEAAGKPRCKVIGNFGVGYNHIDVAAAAKAGIAVSNTPDVLTDATADIAWTLILSTCRRAGEGERQLRAGEWKGFDPKGMLGTHVTGKTLGVIGMGRIGQAIAKRGHFGFDMPVVYFNRSAKELPFDARRIEDMHELLGVADIVVVAVPGGAETVRLIDRAAIAAMRKDTIFVNISRGEVVEEEALIDALEANAIGGAGLDVYEKEPYVPARLTALENCVLLPHLGSATVETRRAMAQMALDNIIAFAEGRAMPQRVN